MTFNTTDLTIVNAQIPDRSGLWNIGIAQAQIIDISPAIAPEAPAVEIIDAGGRLVISGLVDAHFHLDKALLLDRYPAQEGNFAEAMRETLRLKQSFTVEDIQSRARQMIERAIAFGITAMRSHVEVDPIVGLTGMEALLPLRTEYAWGMTLQLAVFAQEGMTPATEKLLRQAMAMGGDVIGSAPYVDADPERNVQIIFDIAQDFDCDVDFHLDFLDDSEPLLVPFVIQETVKRGWQGRVCLGHMTKLAALEPGELAAIAPALRAAGISVLALPASDLYMMSRQDTHNVRRGVAPVHQLAELGVNVGLATNNVMNLFTPFGDGDVLKICMLLAQVLQMGTIASHQLCLRMATTQAARAIGIETYGVEVGKTADLVILDARSVSEAIASPVGRTVIKQGKVVASSRLESQLYREHHR
ncbi:MAG: amidohydrolase family protein [Drouetiella hepatica Uher 2000/2452]|jgi:cytosine deaminase|uniref:Amidohydrolase family protein n=1 Tax=Drouetiella hepatica Uher 2000/2452 TaxID=904376 RepID=A0A951UN56_9CYAN|nr:amidohydrolase family protein [Drouetiella hepatica Uher 2000/2452]